MKCISYQQIRDAMKDEPYHMSLTKNSALSVQNAVNQGIDSHLEACYFAHKDTYAWDGQRLNCTVSPESLPVLLRRLTESEDDNAEDLAVSILSTLGISVDTSCYAITSPS